MPHTLLAFIKFDNGFLRTLRPDANKIEGFNSKSRLRSDVVNAPFFDCFSSVGDTAEAVAFTGPGAMCSSSLQYGSMRGSLPWRSSRRQLEYVLEHRAGIGM
jgi:hypothetical protein